MSTENLHDPAVREFLTAGTKTAHLAWVSPEGRALVTPVWFVLDGDRVAFTTGKSSAKGKALVRDSRVTVGVDLEEPPYGFVQIQGSATLSDDLTEVRRIATLAAARYMGPERADEFGERNAVAGEVAVFVTPEKVIAHLNVTA